MLLEKGQDYTGSPQLQPRTGQESSEDCTPRLRVNTHKRLSLSGRGDSTTPLLLTPSQNASSRGISAASGYDSALPLLRVWVQSLLGELRFHQPHGVAKKTKQLRKSFK